MIAALYCRKSTDQAVADEAKSVTRQIEHGRAYAARKGWTVDEAHIYVDDGISGAEFLKRPGFLRLMNALKPTPPFGALIMSEESRLGREMVATMGALKELVTAGVRVFYYLDDKERTLDSPIEKAMMALETFGAELEKEKTRLRVYDSMARKARAGYVTGGRCFGYDNHDVLGANGERSHVEQRINETEAAIVRRIFELAAEGVGQVQIAKRLNADGTPAPRAQQGRPRAWVQSSVHAVLFRERYRGEIIWNKTRKRDRWGQTRVSDRPETEWMRVSAPQLRIVPESLWRAAHARIAAARDVTQVSRASGRVSQYLLPGLARCAWCNGGMHVRTRRQGKGARLALYACTSHYNRGPSVCQNQLQIPMLAIDRAVLGKIGNILTPDLVEHVIAGVRDAMDPKHNRATRDGLEQQIAALDQQLANLAEAIAIGGDVPALVARLTTAHQRRQELDAERQACDNASPAPRVNWRHVERQARQLLTDWRGLLAEDVEAARPMLRELLDGPIRFTPIVESDRRGFRFDGAVKTGGLLAGIVRGNEFGVPGRNAPLVTSLSVPFSDQVILPAA